MAPCRDNPLVNCEFFRSLACSAGRRPHPDKHPLPVLKESLIRSLPRVTGKSTEVDSREPLETSFHERFITIRPDQAIGSWMSRRRSPAPSPTTGISRPPRSPGSVDPSSCASGGGSPGAETPHHSVDGFLRHLRVDSPTPRSSAARLPRRCCRSALPARQA